MIKKAIAFVALVTMTAALTWADDPSEQSVSTSPLKVYSGGFGIGAFQAINKELQDQQKNYLKLSFQNTVYFRENAGVFFDVDWFLPGNNYGADIGFDFVPFTGDFRPFIGAGVGAHYFDKGGKFGDNIGPSGTVHVGFALDLTDRVQMRIRVPYHIIGNETRDQTMGVEVGFLFTSRFHHVKKLNYR